jgi:DNA-directed RNA polymerase subunit RPC12/RpoP
MSYACPHCGSTKITPAAKESDREYQIGPSFGHYKSTEKETYEVMKCLDCGRTFHESEAVFVEEEDEEEEEESEEDDEELDRANES